MRCVTVYDLQFEQRLVRCRTRTGASIHHVLDFGMPKLNQYNINHGAFFLYRYEGTEKTGPWGTGFVVARPMKGPAGPFHLYGVTNRHVAHKSGASIIRVNTVDGKTRDFEYLETDWQFIPDQDDLAVVDITDDTQANDQVAFIPEGQFITERAIAGLEIGPGDDVYMLGLFNDAHTPERNIPVVRFGNLAMMATEQAPIEQADGSHRPSHLVDMRSKAGFSGSPVMVYRVPEMDLDRTPGAPLPLVARPKFSALLGVHCAQFWEEIKFRKKEPKKEAIGDPIKEGDHLYVEGAMNIVIPAWRITEVLNLEIFEMARKEREPRYLDKDFKGPQAESVEPDHPSSDANPKHREDFNSLLDVAGQKREQAG